jgi:hypothetical protein
MLTTNFLTYVQCWRLIHGELTRLEAPEWKFFCVSGEKCLQTVWDEITSDFKDIQYLYLTQAMIWNAARARDMIRPLTPVEDRRIKEGIPRETVVKDLLYFGTQKDLRRLRTIPRQGPKHNREPVRLPPECHKHGDPATKLEGRPGQLHHRCTVGRQTGL